MSSATTTRPIDELDQDRIGAITGLLLEGRRVHEVIAHGLTRRPGWRRQHVVDLVAEKGWTLDSDGRVPKALRTSQITPAIRLAGAPTPAPPREPVAEWPEKGTVTQGPRAVPRPGPAPSVPAVPRVTAIEVDRAITGAKSHPVARIRSLAQKAEDAIAALYDALHTEQKNDELRRRLAQVEAEAERLRAQLGAKSRPRRTKPAAASTTTEPRRTFGGFQPTSEATKAKPINHGTWSGYLQHSKRDIPVPAGDPCGCLAAKDRQIAKLHGKAT